MQRLPDRHALGRGDGSEESPDHRARTIDRHRVRIVVVRAGRIAQDLGCVHVEIPSAMTSARESATLRRRELVGRVDVAKGLRFVVEGDLDDGERRIPRVDLAAARFEERREVRQHAAAHEAEHGMRLVERLRDRELRRLALERVREARTRSSGRNGESQGTVDDERRASTASAPHAGPRAGPRSRRRRPATTGCAERRIAVEILVGVDQRRRRPAARGARARARSSACRRARPVPCRRRPCAGPGRRRGRVPRCPRMRSRRGRILERRQPCGVLPVERVPLRRTIDRIVERGERRVRLARPFAPFEKELRAACTAELPERPRRRFVCGEIVRAGGDRSPAATGSRPRSRTRRHARGGSSRNDSARRNARESARRSARGRTCSRPRPRRHLRTRRS